MQVEVKRKYCVDLGGSNEIITKINAKEIQLLTLESTDGHELVCLHTFELIILINLWLYFQDECHGELNLNNSISLTLLLKYLYCKHEYSY